MKLRTWATAVGAVAILVAGGGAGPTAAAAPAAATTSSASISSIFWSTVTSALPPVAQLAVNALGKLISKLGGGAKAAPGAAGTPSAPSAPTGAAGATAAAPRAGLAYSVFRVDAAKTVTPAKAEDTYKPGEGIAIAVTNNVPGILDVVNIDGAGARAKLDSVKLTQIQQTMLPAAVKGFYVLNADSTADEKIELRFFPCKVGDAESMGAVADAKVAEVVTQLAAVTAVKPAVAQGLGACPTAVVRDAATAGVAESMSAQADNGVALAATALAAATAAQVKPVIVTIPVKRSK